jgi:lipid A 3-O-deacylase
MNKVLVLVVLLLASAGASALDGVFIERGEGNYVDQVRAGMLWKWDRTWPYHGDWLITGAWEAAVGAWRGEKPADNNQVIGDIGIQPVFHMAPREGAGMTPYLEGSILGLHLISRAFAYDTRKFGSSFQFGHFLGFGVNFGEKRAFGMGFRFQHLSNAGIVQPNQGVNFKQLHLAYNF